MTEQPATPPHDPSQTPPPPAPSGSPEPPSGSPQPDAAGWPHQQELPWGASPGWHQQPPGWPPASGGWGQWPPAPQPPMPQRHRARNAALLVAVFLAAVGGGVGASLATRSSGTQTSLIPSSGSSQGQGSGSNGSGADVLPTPNSSSGTSAALDPNAIAARVGPAVVDIEVTLSGQGLAEATGMVLTSSGIVLTNNHVVEGATSVTVQVGGTGPNRKATVIGVDPVDDIALIQITGASGLPTVSLGDSNNLSVGDQVVALGNALGRGGPPQPTSGTVTALDQSITASDAGGANAETLTNMIEVRAGIQQGDSGGPMVDRSGKVVGMTTAGSARARVSGTVGFAIPIDKAMTIARQIQTGSGPNVQPGVRGIMGVEVDTTTTDAGGAVVAQVESGSPAEGAGIKAGDVITAVDSTQTPSADALSNAMKGRKPGDSVTVHWKDSSGGDHSAKITLEAGPPA